MQNENRFLSYVLVVGGIIGLLFSTLILIEKMNLVQDPNYIPPCNISPFISCGSVMVTPQASIFGFPNSFLGMVGFSVMMTVGMALLAGATYKRWFWLSAQVGMTFSLGFVYWLFFQSVYRIGALCPYCMVVWTVTIPMFWYLTLYNLREGHLPLLNNWPVAVDYLHKHSGKILALFYFVIVAAILIHFRVYWGALM